MIFKGVLGLELKDMPVQKVYFNDSRGTHSFSTTSLDMGKSQIYQKKTNNSSPNPKTNMFYNKWYIPSNFQFTKRAPDEQTQIKNQLKQSF